MCEKSKKEKYLTLISESVQRKEEKGEAIKVEERKISKMAVITFIVSVGTIPLFALSSYDFPNMTGFGHHRIGLSREFYDQLFRLCKILPLIPLGLGIAALVNIAIRHRKLRGIEYAILGMFLAIASFFIYWISFGIVMISTFPPAS